MTSELRGWHVLSCRAGLAVVAGHLKNLFLVVVGSLLPHTFNAWVQNTDSSFFAALKVTSKDLLGLSDPIVMQTHP